MSKGTLRTLLVCLMTAYCCTLVYSCTNDKTVTPKCRDSILTQPDKVETFYCHPDARLDMGGTQPACLCPRAEVEP